MCVSCIKLAQRSKPSRETRGNSKFSCSLQKGGRFSDRALAAKPSFVLQVREQLPVVWSAHFSERALAKCGIKGILIVIITSTCPLKYNPKYHLKPQPQSGNGVCFSSNATTWAVSVTSWGLFCIRHCSDVEVKGWHLVPLSNTFALYDLPRSAVQTSYSKRNFHKTIFEALGFVFNRVT